MRISTLLALLVLVSALCGSCVEQPTAMFRYAPVINPEAGELIRFNNESFDAETYSWEFGNGETSEEEATSVRFARTGKYEITLTAYSKYRASSYTETIDVQSPTVLDLWTYDTNGLPLSGGDVEIYADFDDAYYGRDMLYSDVSSLQGHVSFKNMEAQTYYVVFLLETQNGAFFTSGNVGPLILNEVNEFVGTAEFYADDARRKALSAGQRTLSRR